VRHSKGRNGEEKVRLNFWVLSLKKRKNLGCEKGRKWEGEKKGAEAKPTQI